MFAMKRDFIILLICLSILSYFAYQEKMEEKQGNPHPTIEITIK